MKYKKAMAAFKNYLENLKANLEITVQERLEHEAKFPEFQEAWDEAMVSGSPEAQAHARDNVQALIAALEACRKREELIKETMTLRRESPTLQKLAEQFWEEVAEERSELMAKVPDALVELEKAQETYLAVVAKTGALGTAISRCDALLNKCASPFMAKPAYQPIFALPRIFLDNSTVLRAYDPNRTLEPAINPAVLERPQPSAETVLAVINKEDK